MKKQLDIPEVRAWLAAVKIALQRPTIPDDAAEQAIQGVVETLEKADAMLDLVTGDAALVGLLREFAKLRLAKLALELEKMHSQAVRDQIIAVLMETMATAARAAMPLLLTILRDGLLTTGGLSDG